MVSCDVIIVVAAKEKLKMATSERTAFQQRHMANYAKDAVLRAQFRQLENAEQTAKKQLKDAEERCKVAEKYAKATTATAQIHRSTLQIEE